MEQANRAKTVGMRLVSLLVLAGSWSGDPSTPTGAFALCQRNEERCQPQRIDNHEQGDESRDKGGEIGGHGLISIRSSTQQQCGRCGLLSVFQPKSIVLDLKPLKPVEKTHAQKRSTHLATIHRDAHAVKDHRPNGHFVEGDHYRETEALWMARFGSPEIRRTDQWSHTSDDDEIRCPERI